MSSDYLWRLAISRVDNDVSISDSNSLTSTSVMDRAELDVVKGICEDTNFVTNSDLTRLQRGPDFISDLFRF